MIALTRMPWPAHSVAHWRVSALMAPLAATEVRPDRGDVEDAPAGPLRDQLPGDGLGRDERAPDVELHDPVPVRPRVALGRVERLAGTAADGVDQDVDPAEAVQCLLDHPVAVGLAGHVGHDREAFRPGGGHPIRRRVEAGLGPSGDRDLGARAGEGHGHLGPDAAAPAGDDRNQAVEAEDVELAHPCSRCRCFDRLSSTPPTRARSGPVGSYDSADRPAA